MALYHLSTRVISRAQGRSAVAAAAYRSAERLVDERTGLVHDYTRRSRHEIEGWIEVPEQAPEWARERSELWNRATAAETRRNSRTAREIEVALPVELSREAQNGLVRSWVREELVARGLAADVSVHRDPDGRNPHAHVLMTTREIGAEGFGRKDREQDRGEQLGRWREGWADRTNRELERAGVRERIDHRSHRDRGIDREPTVHEGPYVRELESRGYRTDRADENREIRTRNAERERERREIERDRTHTRGREIER
ncbi:MAG: MobA/MobL family protein [Actinomycetota bacterium]|jgi:ATP-dependent exoDNAse (exonuclease V) alpha subunit|nr:MobA/MobL family protein [Actinomycetota bacterium]